ncbi:MAG: serine/threonine protein kinase [bacterium]
MGKVLGQGSFGITYKGSHSFLRRVVAIKEFCPPGCSREGANLIPPRGLSEEDYHKMKQRFVFEARTLARVYHPGVPAVYDVFEENSTAYFVMEYIEGESLSDILDRRKKLNEDEALNYIRQIGEVLEAVHKVGIIHRDVRPENIIVGKDGRARLIDFGAAREYAQKVVQPQSIIYTNHYTPPEIYSEFGRIAPFTDIYSLSATLYHLLTGRVPPSAPKRQSGTPLPDVRQLNSAISERVAEAVKAGMALDPAERPQTVSQFLSLLSSQPSVAVEKIPATVSHQEMPSPLKRLLNELTQIEKKLKEEEISVELFYIASLKEYQRENFTHYLFQGKDYMLACVGDGEVILDLNISVYSSTEKLVAEDKPKTNLPKIWFQAEESGTYIFEIWSEYMKGEKGFYSLILGRKTQSLKEKESTSLWESVFEKLCTLISNNASFGYECFYSQINSLKERSTLTLTIELEKAREYLVMGWGDEVNISDLDMIVNLPDGQELVDRGMDNNPTIRFSLDDKSFVKIKVIPSKFREGKKEGYYVLFIGRHN